MKADRDRFFESISGLNEQKLRALCLSLHERVELIEAAAAENERIYTQVHVQYAELKEMYDALSERNKQLETLLAKEIEKNQLHNRSLYGRKTESTVALFGDTGETEEYVDESETEQGSDLPANEGHRGIVKKHDKRQGQPRKPYNTLQKATDTLPTNHVYDLDVKRLDEQYGEDNWRIVYWHSHKRIRCIMNPYYVEITYTPVVSVGLEHMLFTEWYENPLIDKSMISQDLLAEIFYYKYYLSLPVTRQSQHFLMHGIPLGKQTMLGWINRVVPEMLGDVYDHMTRRLLECKYHHCDETYIQVNKDGYGPGHKSFMWVHTTSDLLEDVHPIVIFCYEASRSTDHLRRFYAEFMGYITCDAYISYKTLEDESNGDIVTTGCLMHLRRYFAEAFFLNNVFEMDENEVAQMPETRILLMIREIYGAENQLRDMTAEERLKGRQETVKPLMDILYGYIHEIAVTMENCSERMKKAVTYAVNQEEHVRRFLDDGNISCDNGKAERIIRSYSVGRSNWLFADTILGAEVNAIMYSIVQTAVQNGANVIRYLRYLLEGLTGDHDRLDEDYMDSMMPWSEEYRRYEREGFSAELDLYQRLFPPPERPKATTVRAMRATANGS